MSHPAGVGNARHRYPDYEGYAEGACFPVFRREALLRTGLYDTALVRNQDDDLNFRFRQAGGRVFISHRARCTYFVRESASELFKQYFSTAPGVWPYCASTAKWLRGVSWRPCSCWAGLFCLFCFRLSFRPSGEISSGRLCWAMS